MQTPSLNCGTLSFVAARGEFHAQQTYFCICADHRVGNPGVGNPHMYEAGFNARVEESSDKVSD